jgi:microcin C transport system substrate-binding protein
MEYPKSLDYVIFNLRPDVTFADGTGMTARDLKFTFELFMEQGLPSFRAAFGAMIDSVEVLGPQKIKFTFAEGSPERDRIGLAGTFPAFSQAWFEAGERRLDEGSLTPIMGTGPYVIESYDINRRITYQRREDYWGDGLPQNIGRYNFDRIRIEYFADSNAAFEGFKAGAYTFRNENASKQWATAYDFPGVRDGHVVATELPNGDLASGQGYVFNLRREKFQDPRVREAVNLMFNFEWSNQSLFYGLYDRVRSFWGNSTLEARGVPDIAERALLQPLVDEGLLPKTVLSEEVTQPSLSNGRQLDRKNLRKASRLLDDAGWIVGDDGMRRKNGEVLRIEILDSSPSFDRINIPFVQNLERLGVQAIASRVDPAQETARLRNYDFDMTTHSFRMGWEPSSSLKQWFHSDAREGSSRNLMGLDDPAVDLMVDAVVGAQSKAEMETAVRALDRVLRAHRFWVPQWFKDTHTVAYYDQYEHPDNLPPFALGELDFWWFNAAKHEVLVEAGALR